jgi:hypothetical protein
MSLGCAHSLALVGSCIGGFRAAFTDFRPAITPDDGGAQLVE